jgi:hypothetical protein
MTKSLNELKKTRFFFQMRAFFFLLWGLKDVAWPKGDVKLVKEEKKRSSFENEKKQKLGTEIISLLTTFLLALKVWVFIFTKIDKFF